MSAVCHRCGGPRTVRPGSALCDDCSDGAYDPRPITPRPAAELPAHATATVTRLCDWPGCTRLRAYAGIRCATHRGLPLPEDDE